MKRSKIIALAVVALLLMAGSAWASTANSVVPVNAWIGGSCVVVAGSIDFGNVTADGQAGAVTQPTINCTTAMAYTVTDDDGVNELAADANRLSDGLGNFLGYTFTYTAAGVGTGTANNMDIVSNINGYTGAEPAGNYTDNVTLTITW
jgi:spore coat protein U-like protein